ncbi:alpha/beta hydrolase [Spirosoma rhododendri]|uniref:Carbohydrate esterase n=1 Tax=Spirosoma rhododendri TaxID=2728024 RepID=A0A7L5DPJ6_9BACT|nr:alpha/beta hydrolase-fold protein [Spirosoma rhododendri]QJD80035.1 carbohydrate esterase [Spirosoma rhododendri]
MSLRFELTTPETDDRPVFLSGNFCEWYPDLAPFQLHPTAPGQYALELPLTDDLPDTLEYKYTRGGWDEVELDAWGQVPLNRTTRRKAGTRRDTVPHWRHNGHAVNPDYWPILALDEPLPVPQLNAGRRVRVWLPYDYNQADRAYPVLYLNDGQNLAGEGEGYGSWRVDRTMALLASQRRHEIILVLIDHGGSNRVGEFTPDRTLAGTGNGRRYLDFLVDTLKPRIDAQFRTRPEPAHTGLGGSSLGGLISLYGGLLHPGTFGRLLVFSPSLWISQSVFRDVRRLNPPEPMQVYLYGGQQESRHMVSALEQLVRSLTHAPGRDRIEHKLVIDPTGRHNEATWGRAFLPAIQWLF